MGMKPGSPEPGRDGRLVVVRDDLDQWASADHLAPTRRRRWTIGRGSNRSWICSLDAQEAPATK
jgi:hypothetical protein